ncbi:MAG: hypothetical protein ACOYME_08500 [Prochlorotrichaceae cyanobacterium]|jgi:hypothetical protein
MINPSTSFLLTPEESQRIDLALMTNRDKFATRAAVYALRILQQMSTQSQTNDRSLTIVPPATIRQWLSESDINQMLVTNQSLEWDDSFLDFWTQLIDSAQRSLMEAATQMDVPLHDLTIDQIIHWFEKRRLPE